MMLASPRDLGHRAMVMTPVSAMRRRGARGDAMMTALVDAGGGLGGRGMMMAVVMSLGFSGGRRRGEGHDGPGDEPRERAPDHD
jgi:hypothetical protein